MKVPQSLSKIRGKALIVGTFDTKGRELLFLKSCLERQDVVTLTVDLSTDGRESAADVQPTEVANYHPGGANAVFMGDRGSSITGMAEAFKNFLGSLPDVAGVIGAGGSGGTAVITPGMRNLPVGVPKVMVSTVASGNVSEYVGPSDIMMLYSVTDVSGLNRISERVLSNAAHALAGMVNYQIAESEILRPAIGLTMFGVTTPCVQAVTKELETNYDCLVFHATGTGGQSMEKLVDSGLLMGVLDITTTEVADMVCGGVFPASKDRFGAIIRSGIPYVGSCGAIDMANFGSLESVPERYRQRNLYIHNPQVTLMRTTVEENRTIGRWIAERLNRMTGPVRFLIPEGGVSAIDVPGMPFFDREADQALFEAIESIFVPGDNRKLIKLPFAINDPAFSSALVDSFREIIALPKQIKT